MDNPPLKSTDPTLLREAVARRFYRRSVVKGQITLPAVPGLIDEYVAMCERIFTAVGRKFSAEQLAHAKTLLEGQLAEAFTASQRSNIVISFDAPIGTMLNYHIKPEWQSIEGIYENWVATREPPYFGTHPDARVVALASQAADPATYRVLDLGAGTGRNALALARRGHPVDAVEVTAKFADMIRADAQRYSLDVWVIQRDVFATTDDLRRDYQMIVVSEVVPDFRTVQQLRGVFELAARCLAPGGQLVVNTFLARHGYIPDDATREFGQQVYSCMFTRDELSSATADLPLELLSDDSAHDYEKEHLPESAWPPTGWYVGWASGLDVFDVEREKSPIELRWLVYRKTV
jgi:precorrin-6B methylase 2